MRPRIDGNVARTVMLFQGDDETYSETIARLLDSPPGVEDLVGTVYAVSVGDLDEMSRPETIRKRIRGDAEERLRERMDELDATASDALALVFDTEWEWAAPENEHVASFEAWFDWSDRNGPPTGVDLLDWLDETKDRDAADALDAVHEWAIQRGVTSDHRRERTLEELAALGDDLGRTPTSRDVNASESPFLRISYLQSTFGSFNDALREAGFEPNQENPASLTREELSDDLVEFRDELGHEPSATEMAEKGPHSLSTYHNYFGSWERAKKAAGIRDLNVNEFVYLSVIDAYGPAGSADIHDGLEMAYGRDVDEDDMEDRIDQLEEMGLVKHTDDGKIELTADGERRRQESEWADDAEEKIVADGGSEFTIETESTEIVTSHDGATEGKDDPTITFSQRVDEQEWEVDRDGARRVDDDAELDDWQASFGA